MIMDTKGPLGTDVYTFSPRLSDFLSDSDDN